jgi:hypothetical protein
VKRTGFRRTLPPRVKSIPQRGPGRGVIGPVGDAVVAQPKREYVRSQALREAFRMIPCQFPVYGPGTICGSEGGDVVCAHSNQIRHGKGRGIKADDRMGAACCNTCHITVDQGKHLTKAERVELWGIAHRRSVALLVERGLWPAGVPLPDDEA